MSKPYQRKITITCGLGMPIVAPQILLRETSKICLMKCGVQGLARHTYHEFQNADFAKLSYISLRFGPWCLWNSSILQGSFSACMGMLYWLQIKHDLLTSPKEKCLCFPRGFVGCRLRPEKSAPRQWDPNAQNAQDNVIFAEAFSSFGPHESWKRKHPRHEKFILN